MTLYEFVVTAFLCACVAHCVLLDAASILVLLRKARLYALGLLAMAAGRDKRWRSRRVDALDHGRRASFQHRASAARKSNLQPDFNVRGGGEAVRVLSCLQEISNNVDAVALAPPGAAPDLPRVPAPLAAGRSTARGNLGTKPPLGDGRRRLEAFCAYALAADEGCVVAVGHSLWFRSFFDEYLPERRWARARARVAKIRNGGVVACGKRSESELIAAFKAGEDARASCARRGTFALIQTMILILNTMVFQVGS
ncbi:hypothetical protein SO694_00028346 [Aureococcus anophagefferens]|uniref:Uncharacterized protein n=1 Tax=Aureococcus anophagefferens TaxID=44056 RepID=A0ABR1FVL6_AURAN